MPSVFSSFEDARLIDVLRDDGTVLMPFDTIWGIGACPTDEAVSAIFTLKSRSHTQPLLLVVDSVDRVSEWAIMSSEAQQDICSRFWPGPVTFIFPKAAHVSNRLTAGRDTVGIRVPDHVELRQLVARVGGALVSSSANVSGDHNATSYAEVDGRIKSSVTGHVPTAAVLNAPSSVVDLSVWPFKILREGAQSADLRCYLQKLMP